MKYYFYNLKINNSKVVLTNEIYFAKQTFNKRKQQYLYIAVYPNIGLKIVVSLMPIFLRSLIVQLTKIK